MFDGQILSEELGGSITILDPADFHKPSGHFDSYFCWCHPEFVEVPGPDGGTGMTLGHSTILYGFAEDAHATEE